MSYSFSYSFARVSLKLMDNLFVVGCKEKEQFGLTTIIFDLEFPYIYNESKTGKIFYHNGTKIELDLLNKEGIFGKSWTEWEFDSIGLDLILKRIANGESFGSPKWTW